MGEDVILFVVIGVVFILAGFTFLLSKRKPAVPKDDAIGDKETKEAPPPKKVKKVEKPVDPHDMSEFIKFDKIANDMIYQNNGERYTMVIQCKGVNYHLMSELEQMSVEEGFIMFLNTLKYPIQLYVQTKSVDLSENVKTYKDRVRDFAEKANEVSAKCAAVEDDVDSTRDEIAYMRKEKLKYNNIAEYVSDITRYVERMALNKHMLQRNFYIVFSYNKNELATTEKFTKEEYEDLCYRELYTRAQAIISSLITCSVTGRVLNSNELAQLVYTSLNKDDSALMNIKDALESGMFRLYTQSEDVLKKKREMLEDELNKEGQQRVEEVVRQAMAKGLLVTEAESEEAVQKEIDSRAIKIIDQSEVDESIKETLKDVIKDNRRKRVERLNEKIGRTSSENHEKVIEEKVLTANDIFAKDEDKIDETVETTPEEKVEVKQEPKVEVETNNTVQPEVKVDTSVIEEKPTVLEEVVAEPEITVAQKEEMVTSTIEPEVSQSKEEPIVTGPISPLAGMEDLFANDDDDDEMIIGTKEGESTNEEQ